MYKKIMLVPLMLLPLSGCVPVVLVAAGATASTTIIAKDPRSFRTIVKDQNAEKRAQDKINNDPDLAAHSHISVAVFNHVALMVGQAQNSDLNQRAYDYVSHTASINRVYNQVKISGSTSMIERSNDSWLTSKVKSALVAQKGVPSDAIKVITENGIVYLMGIVSQDQGELSANTARRVDGVREVVKVFQYR